MVFPQIICLFCSMIKSLNLHGVKHQDAFREVDKFIGESMLKGFDEVHIVTGMSDDMKAIVYSVLEDYEVTCEEDWSNKGKLIIDLTW
jgi:hypothetical protein